jgi:hypothetical protein
MTVALLLPTAGTSAPPDVRGPKCADIFVHSPGYAGTAGGTALVTATVTTASASCPGGVYTAYVYDTSGNLLGSQTFIGNGTTDTFSVQISVNPAPSTVCLVVTSQVNSKGPVADMAPDTGCSDPNTHLSLGGAGAGGFG